uniref:EARP and GARP complex-interacting protein 1 n=1 Tax=Cebus imitator TaxID=2715852 RepID=A0A2K5Q039_CEBIM
MEDDAPVIYGLEFQARALTPQTAETDAIRFLVGTQSLKYDNQIHIIDFDDENNIINKNVLLHQAGEIWHISASPADKGVLATCYNRSKCSFSKSAAQLFIALATLKFLKVLTCAAVWRMPKELESGSHESPDDSSSTAQTLELLCHLDNTAHGNMACVVWEPMGDGKKIISLADNHILLWDLQESSSQAVLASSASLEGKGQLRFTSGRWSPHHNCTQVATASDTTLRGWDTRNMSKPNLSGKLPYVRPCDWGPIAWQAGAARCWCCLRVTGPLSRCLALCRVWNVRYNHSHDQLVLTGSSDSRVILSNMVSISSEPFGHLVDDDDISDQEDHRSEEKSKEPLQDNVIATYEEHEDSVYAVDWSSADPWLFASLSYDGRLVINRVPRALKYHILL